MQFKAQLKLNRAFHSKWVSLKVGGGREWGGFGFRCYIGISELNCMCVCVCLVFHVWSVEWSGFYIKSTVAYCCCCCIS